MNSKPGFYRVGLYGNLWVVKQNVSGWERSWPILSRYLWIRQNKKKTVSWGRSNQSPEQIVFIPPIE